MEITLHPSNISGFVEAPSSKSYFQRAIAAGLLAKGTTRIEYKNHCNDSQAALRVAKNLGAHITDNPPYLDIIGGFMPSGDLLDCGESGLCLRMFSPIAALHSGLLKLHGSGSLLQRPQQLITQALEQFGVLVSSQNGFLPIEIIGPLKGHRALLNGSVSSQVISGLLMALPVSGFDSLLEIENLKSKRYVDMTLEVLTAFGIEIDRQKENIFNIRGNQTYQNCHFEVEGDWSASAFWIVAALISGVMSIAGLNPYSLQADAAIINLMTKLPVKFEISTRKVIVKKSTIPAFTFDASNCPDLFPPIVALAIYADGISTIKGVDRLIYKESNRGLCLQQEFSKLGIRMNIEGNSMVVHPGKVRSGIVSSCNDHRIAMALAVAAMGAEGPVTIEGIESVDKSYPEFFEELAKLTNQSV
ncbi:MAG: 3-phosphoshikimate 1-carboxyvinyltransferase [Bacteroidales bacterium]|nr:3-phosphoshikimate 1-carboxyvinyltransferase [Bacteroidales bacterium]MCF8455319.1 3-phosphoshikimate 1-carboxyvinyltransferase [Bacteroidales bacterium]